MFRTKLACDLLESVDIQEDLPEAYIRRVLLGRLHDALLEIKAECFSVDVGFPPTTKELLFGNYFGKYHMIAYLYTEERIDNNSSLAVSLRRVTPKDFMVDPDDFDYGNVMK